MSETTTTNDTVFRRRVEPTVTPEIELEPTETRNIVEDTEHKEIGDLPQFSKSTPLEDWEVRNGNYGVDFMGIKEIAKEFPLKMQYGYVDKFLKAELDERGMDKTPENWQKLLAEIEEEIGTDKKNSFKRVERLYNYIKTLHKFRQIKQAKDKFRVFYSASL